MLIDQSNLDLEKFRNAFEDEKSEGTATNNSSAIKLDDIPLIQTDANNSKKGFFIRLLFKFVYSLNLKIKEGKIKFVVLKDEDLNVSAANIKEYFYQKLDNKVFMSKYECFTIGVDDYLVIDISPNTDYAMLVNIHAD